MILEVSKLRSCRAANIIWNDCERRNNVKLLLKFLSVKDENGKRDFGSEITVKFEEKM